MRAPIDVNVTWTYTNINIKHNTWKYAKHKYKYKTEIHGQNAKLQAMQNCLCLRYLQMIQLKLYITLKSVVVIMQFARRRN